MPETTKNGSRTGIPFNKSASADRFTAEKLWESEESLRVLMNSNPESIFILDTTGNFIAANEKASQRFGKPVEELIGTNVFSYLSPELAKERKEKVDLVVSSKKPVRFDDSRNNRFFDNYLHPVFDSEGNIIRIAVWVIDFTERKLAVDALKASEEKFRELAENIQDIFWIRKDDEVLYVSPAYETICGKTCESFYKNPNAFLEAIHPEDIGRVIASLTSTQYTIDGLFNEEFRIIRPDGEIRWLWSKTFPVKRNGELLRTVGMAEDISLRKEYEQKIQAALLKEKELNDLKSRFFSMVSHEFRTPLGLILSSAELLQNYGYKWDETKRNEQFEKIKNSVDNLTGLVKDILVLNEDEPGKFKINLEEINFVDFINSLIEEVKSASGHHPQVKFFCPDNSLKITSDKKLLRQIFSNLFSNAIKFTLVEKNIYINLECGKDFYTVEVKDEGIGIPAKDRENIFEPFIRANNVSEIKGSGLGLSIVKRATGLLNGNIKLISKLNEGSVFTVSLPIQLKETEFENPGTEKQ